jgi:hypothetical protein
MLATIGKDLRARLADVEKGYVRRALFGGLQVAMERRGDRWRVAIARIGRPPSATEAEVIARDFALPPGAEWQWTIKPNRKLKVTFHVAEMTWVERTPSAPTTVGAPSRGERE